MYLDMRRCAGARHAFTLIELLVVVAITAVLSSILLPALGRSRQEARAVVCAANLHSLGLAVLMYADDNRGWLPEWGYAHGGGEAGAERTWIRKMEREYGQNKNVLRCPTDTSPHWTRPLKPNGSTRRTSYATSFYVTSEGIDSPLYEKHGHGFNRLDWIRHPASTILFCELAETGEYALADHVHPENWEPHFPREREAAAKELALARHPQKANYAFLDGHAARLAFEETYRINAAVPGKQGQREWLFNKYDPTIAR